MNIDDEVKYVYPMISAITAGKHNHEYSYVNMAETQIKMIRKPINFLGVFCSR
jgi:hypothetical protein